jgi:Tol biopolymer transport system component
MGEVYRARDTRLNRDVAIKVLPEHLSSSTELKARFDRESKAISSLQHPHICVLHDVGFHEGIAYLVMELLEGETLAQRMARKPPSQDEALRIAVEIAGALDKAHRKGIAHRDLKPANIMLTSAGAKLMDFGLAKAAAFAAAADDGIPAFSATMTNADSPITLAGTVVGTVQYMSPEQIQGKEADTRSDIFAFGAVLYEMLTGKRAFEGKTNLSVASAILEKEPEPISKLQPLTPIVLDHVVQRALAKDPAQRWQSAADLKSELEWIRSTKDKAETTKGTTPSRLRWLVAGCGLLAVALALALVYTLWSLRNAGQQIHAYLPTPPNAKLLLLDDDAAGPAVISPDGSRVAFTATEPDGKRQLWVRALGGNDAKPVPGTEEALYPFWSPDSKWLGFFSEAKMKRVPVDGGAALDIADVSRPRGGSWNANNEIVFAPGTNGPIFVVPATGGTPKAVTQVDVTVHSTHRWPMWLPDGKRFLFLASNHGSPAASARNGIYVASLDGKQIHMVTPGQSNVALAAGYLLLTQNDTLTAQLFDERRAEVHGDPVPLAQSVVYNLATWRGAFDVSQNGTLIYQAGSSLRNSSLLWQRPGTEVSMKAVENLDQYRNLRLSLAGDRVAVTISSPASDLWVYDLKNGAKIRLTFTKGGYVSSAVWSPDGKKIAFSDVSGNEPHIYVKDATGLGQQELLLTGKLGESQTIVDDWSNDGRYILYTVQRNALWLLPVNGDHRPKQFRSNAPSTILGGRFSPDGRWVAYLSNESGRQEAYVTSFPEDSGQWQVSSEGAVDVHWSRDGRAILCERFDGVIIRVPFTVQGKDLEMSQSQSYVKIAPFRTRYGNAWDIAADGRVIVNTASAQEDVAINVVTNWLAGLKK